MEFYGIGAKEDGSFTHRPAGNISLQDALNIAMDTISTQFNDDATDYAVNVDYKDNIWFLLINFRSTGPHL